MASEYLYGTYGHLADSVAEASTDVSTVALYIGTAPVNLVRGFADKGVINKPVKITNNTDAQKKIGGIAADWSKYTLSEAVAAHFANTNGNVGPIYVINVLDPAVHKSAAATTVTLNFVNGKASFASEDIILDTLTLADKAEGTDYAVDYNYITHKVTIVSVDSAHPLAGAIVASYYTIDTTTVTEEDIIGVKTEAGAYTGIQAAALMYQTFGVTPNLYAAPGWSEKPDVYKSLIAIATKLNGHWDGFVYADIPILYDKMSYTYDEVSSPTPDSNPSTEGWFKLADGSYIQSEDDHLVESAYYVVSADDSTPPTSDPAAEEYYERTGSEKYTYTPTEDTTVDAGKTYYKVTASAATTVRGDNPASEGWFIQGADGYVAASETYVVSGTTYYTRTGSGEETANDTIAKAVDWKDANGYTSERSKAFWPMANGTDNNIYHLSTLAMAETLRLDFSHGGVPMESCGNTAVAVKKQFFGSASTNAGFDVTESNDLCSNGIDTVVFWGGGWRLWGDHTAAYKFGAEVDPRDIFDVSMRMLLYLTNRFQRTWAHMIDKPFTKALKDTILVREQERLDALVVMGALIGKPKIVFESDKNPTDEMKNGNFRWDIQVTPTPPLKSASAYVAYTDAGFSAFFD